MAARASDLWRRFGFPDVAGSGGFVSAMVIDALGAGLFLPFSLLFFLSVSDLPLATVGLALTVSRLIGLPLAALSGAVVDRFGAKRVAVTGMFLRGAAYGGYLLVDGPVSLFAATVFAAVCDRLYWAAHPVLIGQVASGSQRERWFGLVDSARNFGIGIGGLLAGLVVASLPDSGLVVVTAANAASFVLAGVLLSRQALAGPAGDRKRKSKANWHAVLADRPFAVLSLSKTLMAVNLLVVPTIVPVYAVRAGAPTWLPAALFGLNCALVVACQAPVVRATERRPRTWTLSLSAVFQLLSFCVFAAAVPAHADWALVLVLGVAMTVFTAGELTSGPASDALALDLSPAEGRGRYLAAYNLSWGVASVAVPVVSTSLLTLGSLWLWSALAVVALGSRVCVSWLGRQEAVAPVNGQPPAAVEAAAS